MANSDGKIVSLIKLRKQRGFDLLYDKYAGALYYIISKTQSEETIAASILTELFVFAWWHIDLYDPNQGSLFGWLLQEAFRIERNY